MKMMSSTSTTSTSGVTFMSGWMSPYPGFLRHHAAIRSPLSPRRRRLLAPALERVDQLARRGGERQLVPRDLGGEVVEREHRRDGDRESERRLDECLGDAGRHRG